MSKDEFYIGYAPKAPRGYRNMLRLVVIGLLALVMVVGGVLALSQRGFSSGTFDLGEFTQLEGVIQPTPVPLLKVEQGTDLQGNTIYRNILLINFGKFGAEGLVSQYAQMAGGDLTTQKVTLEGKLIYRDGVTLMELSKMEAAFKGYEPLNGKEQAYTADVTDHGETTLQGEIVDPKCFFGVMKPGQGKPHRSCAVRCISGGIPPVLRVETQSNVVQYYVLVGPKGEKINQDILDRVAEPVQVTGQHVSQDDWQVIYTDPHSGIVRL